MARRSDSETGSGSRRSKGLETLRMVLSPFGHSTIYGFFLVTVQGVADGQGGLACCDSWGRKESDTTERLNWTELNWTELNETGCHDLQFASVQWLSRVRLFATPWVTAHQASLSITSSRSSLRLMSIESVMPSSHLILCHPALLPPVVFPSIRVFSWATCIRWPKYWSFSISPSNEYSELISYKIDRFDLLAVQGTLRSLLQHHNPNASILQHSAFFMVQLSYPYMTTGKTTTLTKGTFFSKVMSLLFNMLSRLVKDFLPRSKHHSISWLQSPSVVILEPPKIKYVTVSIVSPSICHEVMGPDAMMLVFWMLSFKTAFSLSSFTLIKRLFSSSTFSTIRVVSSAYLRLLIWHY